MSLVITPNEGKHSTSQVAINAIVYGCEQLFDDTRTRIKAGVMHHLSLKGIDTSQLTEMGTFMDNIWNPKTEHQKKCRLLQGPLRNHHSTTYGINGESVQENK